MPQNATMPSASDLSQIDSTQTVRPSFFSAVPHYLPLGIFPLILVAAIYGGWWLLPPLLFMSISGRLDRALGVDGRNMDPAKTPERRLFWHNIPVWTWALLWPPTLIFGLWQILVANPFTIWEDVLLAIVLTMEAQAVFVVGHEMVHRRATWERRLGEFLLSSASYPQYATEHVYIHHAKVGTPHDVGSAPKGQSFWAYFPRELASNLTNSWKVAGERLARRRLPLWHYSNPFWRYGIAVAFWYGLVFWMGGIWAVPVFAFLGLCCVFSMKISNYFQHYGLRRVRLPNGRWEKVLPRHSWSADWKFSNWMFFNMQRHADHHAAASRHYPLLQVRSGDESPELPGTYADMMNIVLRPKRWFAKMDPLVDQWRAHFYPEIDDWSAYDSPISAERPDAFEAIVEIFGAAPRLAKWIERNSELLDNLQSREFTDLDLPKGFGPDRDTEAIARRGLARLYWTRELGVREMKDRIAELPAANASETAEVARNWSNDKAFQIGMHVVRGNLLPGEARTALANLADATIWTVLAGVLADHVERAGAPRTGGVAAVLLGDLASRDVYPGVAIEVLFVHDGWRPREFERLCRRFRKALSGLAQDSLLFSPLSPGSNSLLALPLCRTGRAVRESCFQRSSLSSPGRAACSRTRGQTSAAALAKPGERFWLDCAGNDSLVDRLREPSEHPAETGVSRYAKIRGGLDDVERAARFLQLTAAGATASRIRLRPPRRCWESAGNEDLSQAAVVVAGLAVHHAPCRRGRLRCGCGRAEGQVSRRERVRAR